MKTLIKLIENETGHFYTIKEPDNNFSIILKSSSNVLTCFPNPGLKFWMESTSPEEIARKQSEGKLQGTKVHKSAELQQMGETISTDGITDEQIKKLGLVDKDLISYLKRPFTRREEGCLIGLENFWNDYEPITIASELMVWKAWFKNEKNSKQINFDKYIKLENKEGWILDGFAGTLDFIGYLKNKKTKKYELWQLDFKISNTLDRSYDLQDASYWKAFEFTYKKRLPGIRLGTLQLGNGNKCKYTLKEVKNKDTAWDMFLKTNDIWMDLHKNNMQLPVIERREKFSLNKFFKKGKLLKIN